jgi:hypothetical protein
MRDALPGSTDSEADAEAAKATAEVQRKRTTVVSLTMVTAVVRFTKG